MLTQENGGGGVSGGRSLKFEPNEYDEENEEEWEGETEGETEEGGQEEEEEDEDMAR